MSPTVFREGPYRFFFFSREETRPHVHVTSAGGEAKIWLEPEVVIARSYLLSARSVRRVLALAADREQEIRDAWTRHFER